MAKEKNVKTQIQTNDRRAVVADLIKKTNRENPAPEDLQRLRQVFDEVPELFRKVGNPGKIMIENLLDDISGKSAFVREATERNMKEMQTELGFGSSTFVEKMLIHEILLRWLRLQLIENSHRCVTNGSHNIDDGMYFEKRLHLAQRRYLASIETLAKVRRLIVRTQLKGAQMFKDLLKPRDENGTELLQ